MVSEIDSQREEKFQIDLMVKIYSQFYNNNTFPLGKFISGIVIYIYIYLFFIFIESQAPPPSRSSPERDSEIDFVAVDPKSMVTYGETVSGTTLYFLLFMTYLLICLL
jgi:hypothetical protein